MNFSLFLISASLGVFASFFMFSADVHSLQKRTKIPIPNSQGRTTMGPAIVPVIGHFDKSLVTRVQSHMCEHDSPHCKAMDGLKVIVRATFPKEAAAEIILASLYLRVAEGRI